MMYRETFCSSSMAMERRSRCCSASSCWLVSLLYFSRTLRIVMMRIVQTSSLSAFYFVLGAVWILPLYLFLINVGDLRRASIARKTVYAVPQAFRAVWDNIHPPGMPSIWARGSRQHRSSMRRLAACWRSFSAVWRLSRSFQSADQARVFLVHVHLCGNDLPVPDVPVAALHACYVRVQSLQHSPRPADASTRRSPSRSPYFVMRNHFTSVPFDHQRGSADRWRALVHGSYAQHLSCRSRSMHS